MPRFEYHNSLVRPKSGRKAPPTARQQELFPSRLFPSSRNCGSELARDFARPESRASSLPQGTHRHSGLFTPGWLPIASLRLSCIDAIEPGGRPRSTFQ